MILLNLNQKKIRGIESQRNVLLTTKPDGKLSFVTPDKNRRKGIEMDKVRRRKSEKLKIYALADCADFYRFFCNFHIIPRVLYFKFSKFCFFS